MRGWLESSCDLLWRNSNFSKMDGSVFLEKKKRERESWKDERFECVFARDLERWNDWN